MRLYREQGSSTSMGFNRGNQKAPKENTKSQLAGKKASLLTQEFDDSHLKPQAKKNEEPKLPELRKPYLLGLPESKYQQIPNLSLSQSLFGTSPRVLGFDTGSKNDKQANLKGELNPADGVRKQRRRKSLEEIGHTIDVLLLDLRKVSKITRHLRLQQGMNLLSGKNHAFFSEADDKEETAKRLPGSESKAFDKNEEGGGNDINNDSSGSSLDDLNVPDILENDYIFSNFKTLGEKKEITEFHKWIDFFTRKIRTEKAENLEGENLERAQIFIKKALELCFKLIGKQSVDKSRLFARIWNEHTRFLQDYLDELVRKIKALETWRSREIDQILNTLNQKNERSVLEQTKREFLTTIKAKDNKIKQLEELIESTYNEKMKHEQEKNQLEHKLNTLRSSMTVPSPIKTETPAHDLRLRSKTELLEKFVEKKDQINDTEDLLVVFERVCQTDFYLNFRDKNTQTDLLDVVESITEIDLSPKKKPSTNTKGLFRTFLDIIPDESPKGNDDDNFKIEFEGESPKLLKRISTAPNTEKIKKENPPVNKKRDRRLSKMISLKRSKTIENNEFFSEYKGGGLSISSILDLFEAKMKEFFDLLELFLGKIASNNFVADKEMIDLIYEAIDSNKKKIKDFVRIVGLRDSDNQAQLMNSKIEAAENQMELTEYKATSENWQKRFNRFYRKYLHLQDILLYEDREAKIKADKDAFKSDSLTDFKDIENIVNKEEEKRAPPSSALLKPPPKKMKGRNRSSSNANPNFQPPSPLILPPRESLVKVEDKSSKPIPVTKMKNVSFIGAGGDFRATKKKILKGVESSNGTAAIKFMRKLKGLPIRPLDLIKPDILLRLISALYTEIFKNEHRKTNGNPLFIYLYDYLLNRYGNSFKTTELKMTAIIRSCLLHESVPRIRVFLKLLGIFSEPYEFDGVELNLYMDCMIGLDEERAHNPGLALVMSFDKNCVVPFKNAHDFCLKRIEKEGKMTTYINLNEFVNDLKACREEHISIKTKSMINADLVVDFLIYQRYCYWRKMYETLFKSLDVLEEKFLSLEQFVLWFKALEGLKYNENKCKAIFEEEADYVDEETERKYIGFKKFALLGEKTGCFSPDKVSKVEQSFYDSISNIRVLEVEWKLKRNLIKLKYLECRCYINFFQKSLRSIDTYFEGGERTEEDDKMYWLRYRMVDEDSQKTYIETQLIPLVPLVLLDIQFIIMKKLPNFLELNL